MINGKRVLAYIPARSGSKGIKDKNIIDLCGKPLIAYTIEAARQSKYIDRLIVSTDSAEYASVARKYGAEVPFLRPVELATDTSPEMHTTLHLMEWLEKEGLAAFDIIIRLQGTSPLRTAKDIDGALTLFFHKNADTIIGVCEARTTPLAMNTLPADHSMHDFIPEWIKNKNRQELPTYYQLNGAIFIANWKFIREQKSWFSGKSYAYIMPQERSVDIDNPLDLEFAKFLLENKLKSKEFSTGPQQVRKLPLCV